MTTNFSLRNGIVLSNVARNHAYHIAEAAEGAGYLKKFITSIYYKPGTVAGRAMHALSARAGVRALKRFELRRAPGLPDDKVVEMPLVEVLEEGCKQLGTRFKKDARAATYLKNEAFDWLAARHVEPCSIFHGFEQCALFSLRKARALGAVTIIEQPIIHRTTLERIERDERAKHGVPASDRHPFWYEQHVARKYKELALTDYVFGGLEYVKETMVENGFPGERVFVVPYGADPGDFRPVARPPRAGFNILYAGPLNFWKGLPYLFDVMEGLAIPGARFTLVGRSDHDWAGYMQRRIAGLGDMARYLGTVPQTDMPQLYADADVLVFPSLVGGLGIVCFEAMATALPVVTSHGDIIIRDGQDGLVVRHDDIEGWRRALRKLAADRDHRLSIGAAGAERLKSFTWEAFRRGMIRAYDEIGAREEAKAARARARPSA
jgi:glycosyltransferase involved in cell wall biosynthesis